MKNKMFALIAYCLRWLAWSVHYLVIWPAATLMLLVIMLFRMENTTPGEAMAQEVAAVTHNVSSGEFRIAVCRDEPLQPFIPPAAQGKSSGLTLHDAPSAVCHNRGSVVTDAKGYAAHIDGSLSVFKPLWVVMAVVFAGLALLMKRRPYFSVDGQMRSAHFRYGIPASRPASAPDAIKTPDNKKEDDRE